MKRSTRSDRFLRVVGEYEQVLILTHDNPDPDGIAASWAVAVLIREKLGRPVRVVAGGAVIRAENLRMLELLRPPIEFLERATPAPEAAVVMVDCVPTAANHVLGGSGVRPVAVIDHHAPGPRRFRVRYRDVRPRVAATATIAGQYLREQGVEPGTDLATALLYGIRTDAIGRYEFSRTDQGVLSWLGAWASHKKLADIESAPLARAYYADLLLAMENAFVYDDALLCFLPRAHGPEIVGEVADLLIRCEGINRVMCGAVIGGDALFSVRTTDVGGDACALVDKALAGLGHGGGHKHRAGGKLALPAGGSRIGEDLQSVLRTQWLAACGVDQQRGTRLVARREIIDNL